MGILRMGVEIWARGRNGERSTVVPGDWKIKMDLVSISQHNARSTRAKRQLTVVVAPEPP